MNRLFAITLPTLTAIFNLSTVAVIWFGAMPVNDGDLSIGNLTAFLQYLAQILFAILTAVFMFILIPRAAGLGRPDPRGPRHRADDPRPAPGRPSAPIRRGDVVFGDVEFRYPGAEQPVLRDISFRADPGETTAIVGSTGSGKTTLINLIPRFYDATAGSVLVDGVDVREMDRRGPLGAGSASSPRRRSCSAGRSPATSASATRTPRDDELWHALEIAQAQDFVEEMEGGLEAPITQGGANVSGGQRQRLAIARALVKKPDDLHLRRQLLGARLRTDARLRAALERELGGATVIIVAQRVGTILHADRIIVMDAGADRRDRHPRELLADNETYREIVYSQMSEEEAA